MLCPVFLYTDLELDIFINGTTLPTAGPEASMSNAELYAWVS